MIFYVGVMLALILGYYFIIRLKRTVPIEYKREGIDEYELVYRKNVKTYLIYATIILVLIAGLRSYNVGSDSYNYYMSFKSLEGVGEWVRAFIIRIQESSLSEFLSEKDSSAYYVVVAALKQLGFTYNMYLVFNASICIIPLMMFIYRYSKNVLWSVLLFYAFNYSLILSGNRIVFAMGLCFTAFLSIERKQKITLTSVICVAAAIFVHITAIVFIIAFLLRYLKFNKKMCGLFIILSFVVVTFSGTISSFLLNFTYYSADASTDLATGTRVYWFYVFSEVLVMLFLKDDNEDNEILNNSLIYLTAFGTLFCGAISYGAFLNLSRYFTTYFCVALPNTLEGEQLNSVNYAAPLIKILYFLICLYMISRGYTASSNLVPYQFFWQA